MRWLSISLLIALSTCKKLPPPTDEPTSGKHADDEEDRRQTELEEAQREESSQPAPGGETTPPDVEVTGVGPCSAPEDCEWVSAPYRSAEDLQQDSSGCCAASCQRPNMVVSKALLEEASTAAQTVCADHRSGKAKCPPPSPCRETGPLPYVIEPLCEAGQCAGRAVGR